MISDKLFQISCFYLKIPLHRREYTWRLFDVVESVHPVFCIWILTFGSGFYLIVGFQLIKNVPLTVWAVKLTVSEVIWSVKNNIWKFILEGLNVDFENLRRKKLPNMQITYIITYMVNINKNKQIFQFMLYWKKFKHLEISDVEPHWSNTDPDP